MGDGGGGQMNKYVQAVIITNLMIVLDHVACLYVMI